MSEPMIEIKGITKQYKLGQINSGTLAEDLKLWMQKITKKLPPEPTFADNRKSGDKFMALNGVSFTVNKGEAVGIIGGNGAGKSTLLKIISRITAPTAGEITLYGRVTSMLEVGTGFNGEMTGRENIYMSGAILGMTKAEIDSKLNDIIAFSECADFIDTPVKRYSSGMFVKLAFAVVAHLDSEIMIMDEVLAVGDMKFQKKCLGKMGDEAHYNNKTILYVSHNMATIRQLCTRCIVLKEGKVVFDGDVESAIKIYAENEYCGATLQVYDLKNAVEKKQKAAFKRIEIIGTDNGVAKENSNLKFKITFHSYNYLENVKIRAVIINSHEIPIGMLVTDDMTLEKDEEYNVEFYVDLSLFVRDKYSIDFRIGTFYGLSAEDYDIKLKAIIIETEDTSRQKNIIWQSAYIGNIAVDINGFTVEKTKI